MRDNGHPGGARFRHPCGQMSQRSVALRNNVRTLLPEAVCTPDTQPFTVPRMEAVVNRDLEEMSMGSM